MSNLTFDMNATQSMTELESSIHYAWRAYKGELTPPLKNRRNQPDDNVMFNTSRVIVDKGAAFLFGKSVEWHLDSDETKSPDEKYLDDTWAFNNKDLLFHKLALNGGITGHTFIKMRLDQPFIRLAVLDSQNVEVVTHDMDYTDVLAYYVTWSGRVDSITRKRIKYRQIIQKVPSNLAVDEQGQVFEIAQHWQITDQRVESSEYEVREQDSQWQTIGEEIWPYRFAPIVDCQNLPSANQFWGVSDLKKDIIHLNEAINRSLSNINRILRLHAHPKTWSRGLTESQIHQIIMDPDGVIHLPGADGSLQNLEMKSDLSAALGYYKDLREALYEASGVPKIAFGSEENINYLAAVAMQVLYGPLIEKTDTKKTTYGGLIREVNRRVLAIAGRGEDRICELVWPVVLPRDTITEAQVAVLELQVGASKDTLLEKLGYDPAYERERRKADLSEEVVKTKLIGAAQPQPATNSAAKPGEPRD